jgi:hypothetical protein
LNLGAEKPKHRDESRCGRLKSPRHVTMNGRVS